MPNNAVRIIVMTCLMTAAIGGAAFADCPSFSFVAITKRSCPTCNIQASLDSRFPGSTIFMSSAGSAQERAIFHGGDVQPGSRATIFYRDAAGNLVFIHTTGPARTNGVIHHEPEGVFIAANPGTRFEVVAAWQDECGAGFQERVIGFVEML